MQTTCATPGNDGAFAMTRLRPHDAIPTQTLRDYPILALPSYRTERLPGMIIQHNLSLDDVDTLSYACVKFSTNFTHMDRYLSRGHTPDDILSAYQARQSVSQLGPFSVKSVSLQYILQLQETFPSLAEDEDLGEHIVEIYRAVRSAMPWIRYIDQAVHYLCEMAHEHQLSSYEAAIEAITDPVGLEDYTDEKYE